MIVGVLELASKYKYGLTKVGHPLYLFKPYDPAIPDHIVGSSHRDTTKNQIAVVTIHPEAAGNGARPRGNLDRLLGPVGDYAAEKEALLLHYNPSKGRRQDPVPEPITKFDAARIEISAETNWIVFHIDPPGCRDVDDALAFHPETGQWAITIADVASAVPEGCEADFTAALRGTSFYDLEGRVLTPMLPPAISEGYSSLLPGGRKRGLTLFLEDGSFKPSWITVATTYTYESILEAPIAAHLEKFLGPSADPHSWIEVAMIRYNAAAAALLVSKGKGLLRVQPQSSITEVKHPALANLLKEAATYETTDVENKRHASLGLAAYCHATSPLRRYADLVNQRALYSIIGSLEGQKLVAAHLNDRMKAARRFSRDLTFLTHVTPGKVHEISVIVMDNQKAYVPLWGRIIKLRHELLPEENVVASEIRIQIYCDPTQRNWKQRVLTAAIPPKTDPVFETQWTAEESVRELLRFSAERPRPLTQAFVDQLRGLHKVATAAIEAHYKLTVVEESPLTHYLERVSNYYELLPAIEADCSLTLHF
jgi:exoribonuclease R